MKGISTLSRVTGKEHAQMASILLGLIIGICLPRGHSLSRLLRAVRGLIDFLFLAQYPMHTTTTLELLCDALKRFHENKDIFVDLGICNNFNIPKLHFLNHYLMYIELFGTTDNCNTEYTEHLHIDLAKDAWDMTNRKDEFPQMTVWLEHHEKIFHHAKYIQWRISRHHQPNPTPGERENPGILYRHQLQMTKHPSKKGVRFQMLVRDYGATSFQDALAEFVAGVRNPQLHGTQLRQAAASIRFHFNAVNVYHKIKFTSYDPYVVGGPRESVVDSIHSRPIQKDKRN
jgi:hypothetical protein